MTEFGICFTLNSILSNYSSPERFIKNDMSLISDPKISDIMPSEEDPFLHVNNIQLPIKLFVHSYNEIPSYLDNFFELNIESAMDMEVMTEKHTAVPDIRSLRISQRHCRFTDESDLKYFPVYSYNLCRLECKMRLAWRLCKCFPFYFRRLYGEKVCNLDGMICIGKHSHEFIHLHDDNGQGFCKGCDAKCEDEAITIVRSTTMPWMFSAEITIILKLLTQTRLQINTIYTETDFLVQIGGLAGLAYGIGLLSLVEIVYFLSLRCYFAIVRGKTIKTNL
ncbi:pickpocket protein 28-like [Atheta coriaria]|uniref:pickpocket protein 28-like n=1 Tax=Dalotia coriaria TaxID=877792 RepID=UPI0031F3691B